VLLRPVPYPAHPERVLRLSERSPRGFTMSVSYPDYHDWKDQNRVFDILAAFRTTNTTLTGRGEPARLSLRMTSHDYFVLHDVQALYGRLYTAEENSAAGNPVAVLNHSLWAGRFGGDPGIIGQSVILDDRPHTIIGILPAAFEESTIERLYLPLEPWADNELTRDRINHQGIFLLGRLKAGVTAEQARSEMETIAGRLEREYPRSNAGVGASIERLEEYRTRDYRAILLILQAAVGFVLLIACANVANLLLARAANRRSEMALRSALGADRLHLAGQALTESFLLAFLGGALGLGIAQLSLQGLHNLLPVTIPRLADATMDGRVLTLTLLSCILTGMLFGLAPALRAQPSCLSEALQDASRGGAGPGPGGRLRQVLPALEISLATVLLIGAGLLIRTVHGLMSTDPGFTQKNLVTLQLSFPDSEEYILEGREMLFKQLRERLKALPGVEEASSGLSMPLQGTEWSSIFIVGDRPAPPRAQLPVSVFNTVDVGYFSTLGIPLLEGRDFSEFDNSGSEKVIVVNETLARHFWPGESAVGKRLKQGLPEDPDEASPWRQIVGVVGSVHQGGLDTEPEMESYIPYAQLPVADSKLVVRTAVEPLALVEEIRAQVHALNPRLPLYNVRSMDQTIAAWMAPRRTAMVLLVTFAAMAAVLAAIGIYGVVAHSVAHRTREMGLRVAVGARRGDLFRLVLAQGMGMACIGIVIGTLGALALTRTMSSVLYGVGTLDPWVFVTVPPLLGLVALAACSTPAYRASRADPIVALRTE